MPRIFHLLLFGFVRTLIAGFSVLFFCMSAWGEPHTHLARALYDEGDWRAARVEALRSTMAVPDDMTSQAVYRLASLHLSPTDTKHWNDLNALVAGDEFSDRAWTLYEMGRLRWDQGQAREAYGYLARAFSEADDYELFLKAAHLLEAMIRRHPEFADRYDPVRQQVQTVRNTIPLSVRLDASPPPVQRGSVLAKPVLGVVHFYRHQIGPAIGDRCSMHPSCSTYAIEAAQRYGAVGVPMTADRLVRETDHVNYRLHPIYLNGREKYADPVSDHTHWFRRYHR